MPCLTHHAPFTYTRAGAGEQAVQRGEPARQHKTHPRVRIDKRMVVGPAAGQHEQESLRETGGKQGNDNPWVWWVGAGVEETSIVVEKVTVRTGTAATRDHAEGGNAFKTKGRSIAMTDPRKARHTNVPTDCKRTSECL